MHTESTKILSEDWITLRKSQIVRKLSVLIFSLLLCGVANSQPTFEPTPAPLNIKTNSGAVTTYPYALKVTDGSLTDNGDGTASLLTGGAHLHGTYAPIDHQHPLYAPAAGYVPYIGATHDLEMGSQHITADTVKANDLYGSFLVSNIIGSMDMRADKWAITGTGFEVSGDIQSLKDVIGVNLRGKYDNQHPEYSTTASLGQVANTLGTHQHNVSYPSAVDFQALSQLATTNQHPESYADINHQHAQYQVTGNYITALTGDVTAAGPGSVAATIKNDVALAGNPTTSTQTSTDNSTRVATTAYVTTGIANAVAGVNPAVAVQAATADILPNSPAYLNGAGGVGATLTSTVPAALVVDGRTIALNERVLVKDEATTANNGVYTQTTLGTGIINWVLTRASDYNQPSAMNNTGAIPVVYGTINTNTLWVQTSQVTTVGTDPVLFTEFAVNPSVILNHQHPLYSTGVQLGTVANQLGTHQHNISYPSAVQFQSLSSIATTNTHGVATTLATGFAPILSGAATDFLDGTGAYSVPASAGGVTTAQLGAVANILGTHQHNVSYPLVAQFQTLSAIATTNQHSETYATIAQNQAVASIATTNQHTGSYATPSQVQAVAAIATTNTHAVATTGAIGFVLALPNDATKYWDGSGAYSTPVSGGSGVDSFETLASPQGLQGIEQLRHNVASYQNYGNVICDGLQNIYGINGANNLTYTGSSSYQYTLIASSSFLSGGTATAASTYGTDTPDKAVDGNVATYWESNGTELPTWWKYDLGAGITKSSIQLTLQSPNTLGQYLKDFILQGSNNDADWTNIYTGQHANDTTLQTFTFSASSSYRYFRLWITSNWVATNYMIIGEITITSPSPISGFIHTIAYPMPTVPTHLGVSVKMDSTFATGSQHTYLKVDVSRDGGTTFTDCHPIVKVGTNGYYRADMETITAQPSGSTALVKISLTGATTKALKGYSIYGE